MGHREGRVLEKSLRSGDYNARIRADRVDGWMIDMRRDGRAASKQVFIVETGASVRALAKFLNRIYGTQFPLRDPGWDLTPAPQSPPERKSTVYRPTGIDYNTVYPGDEFVVVYDLRGVDIKLITEGHLRGSDIKLIEKTRLGDPHDGEVEESIVAAAIDCRTSAKDYPPGLLEAVRGYQQLLKVAKMYHGRVDGIVGILTLRAHEQFMKEGLNNRISFIGGDSEKVKRIQRIVGGEVAGRYGMLTYELVKRKQSELNEIAKRINVRLQRNMSEKRHPILEVDGLWGEKTDEVFRELYGGYVDLPGKASLGAGYYFYIIRDDTHTVLFEEEFGIKWHFSNERFYKDISSWLEATNGARVIYRLLLTDIQKQALRKTLYEYHQMYTDYKKAKELVVEMKKKNPESPEAKFLQDLIEKGKPLFANDAYGNSIGSGGYNCMSFLFLLLQEAGIYPKSKSLPWIPEEEKKKWWINFWIFLNRIFRRGNSPEEALDVGGISYERLLPSLDEEEQSK